jgi:hypothetical protein
LDGKTPLFASLFGHVFLRDVHGIWVLDPNGGTLERHWDDEQALRAELDTEDGQDAWLLAGLAIGAKRRRIPRGEGQTYNFVPPPILGGGFDLDRVMVMDFSVSLHLAGQLHEQIRDLPPGSRISGFQFDENS